MVDVNEIILKAKEDLAKDLTLEEIVQLKNNYLSKKGELSSLMSEMRNLTNEERKELGMKINETKATLEKLFFDKLELAQEKKLNEELLKDKLDLTLPGTNYLSGYQNPFYKVIKEIEDIFIGMGYSIEDGPEVDKDHYVFELLNIPKDHPARDMQDTLYIDEETLLRSHTSSIQAHVMEKAHGQPIKIICPGKTYRRDLR